MASRNAVIIQGNSLRTWSVVSGGGKNVHLSLKTDGRPLNANVELWHGPDYTPAKMSVYVEDGLLTPFNTIIKTTDLFDHIPDIKPELFNSPYHSVSVTDLQDKIVIFIGPPDPYQGGSGISIFLNPDFIYSSHYHETLEPAPSIDTDELGPADPQPIPQSDF